MPDIDEYIKVVGRADDLGNNNNNELINKGLHTAIHRVLSNLVIHEKCVCEIIHPRF